MPLQPQSKKGQRKIQFDADEQQWRYLLCLEAGGGREVWKHVTAAEHATAMSENPAGGGGAAVAGSSTAVMPLPAAADQELPQADDDSGWEELSYAIDMQICQPIITDEDRYFYLPATDHETVISRQVIQEDLKDVQYWRPLKYEYTITDVTAKIVAKVDTTEVPLNVSEVNLARLDTSTFGVADRKRTYDTAEQRKTFAATLESNYDCIPGPLPTVKLYMGQYMKDPLYQSHTPDGMNRLRLPPQHPLWVTATYEAEVPVFSYNWQSKVKYLRSVHEFYKPRRPAYYGVPLSRLNSDSLSIHDYPGWTELRRMDCRFRRVTPFDYRDGQVTCPQTGLWPARHLRDDNNVSEQDLWRPVSIVPQQTESQEKWSSGLQYLTHERPWNHRYCPEFDLNMDKVEVALGKQPKWTDAKTGVTFQLPKREHDVEYMYQLGLEDTAVSAGGNIWANPSPGAVPFQSDQKIRPTYLKADLLYDGTKIIPYNLAFTVHVKYTMLVYKLPFNSLRYIGEDGKKDPQMGAAGRMFGTTPIYTIQTDNDFRTNKPTRSVNAAYKMYVPIDEYYVENVGGYPELQVKGEAWYLGPQSTQPSVETEESGERPRKKPRV